MPRMTWTVSAGWPPRRRDALGLAGRVRGLSTSWPEGSGGVARVLDAHLLEHLTHDQLDVLVVDLDALGLLYTFSTRPTMYTSVRPRIVVAELEQLGRVERALVSADRRRRLDLALRLPPIRRVRRGIGVSRFSGLRVVRRRVRPDHDRRGLFLAVDVARARPGHLGQDRSCPSGLRASNSSTTRGRPCVMSEPATPPLVERPHGELRTGLPDRLRRDDSDGIADLRHLAGRHRPAVAVAAHFRAGPGSAAPCERGR